MATPAMARRQPKYEAEAVIPKHLESCGVYLYIQVASQMSGAESRIDEIGIVMVPG